MSNSGQPLTCRVDSESLERTALSYQVLPAAIQHYYERVHGYAPDDSLRQFFRSHCRDLPKLIGSVVHVAQTLGADSRDDNERVWVLHEANGIVVVTCVPRMALDACVISAPCVQEVAAQARQHAKQDADFYGLPDDVSDHAWLGKASPARMARLVIHMCGLPLAEPVVIDALDRFLGASIQTIEGFAPAQVLRRIREKKGLDASAMMSAMPGGVDEMVKALVASLINQASELAKHALLSYRTRVSMEEQ